MAQCSSSLIHGPALYCQRPTLAFFLKLKAHLSFNPNNVSNNYDILNPESELNQRPDLEKKKESSETPVAIGDEKCHATSR